MEDDPFAVVEAMTIAGFATGCRAGLPLRPRRVPARRRAAGPRRRRRCARARPPRRRHARAAASRFDIEIRRGAGAYICGEETALFNSIEGFRGEPRNKPPFPVAGRASSASPPREQRRDAGERAGHRRATAPRPTRRSGTAGLDRARKLFCVSGHVRRPGVYEVPFGTRLDALIDAGGRGPRRARRIQTVLLGGAAGTFVRPDELASPLTFEDTRRHRRHARLGRGPGARRRRTAGAAAAPRIAAFFRDESCGQCVPCRVGTVRQEELLARLARAATPLGSVARRELKLLDELGQAMRDASICGLGQTARARSQSAVDEARPLPGGPVRSLPVVRPAPSSSPSTASR